jgi:hypothetical protein
MENCVMENCVMENCILRVSLDAVTMRAAINIAFTEDTGKHIKC